MKKKSLILGDIVDMYLLSTIIIFFNLKFVNFFIIKLNIRFDIKEIEKKNYLTHYLMNLCTHPITMRGFSLPKCKLSVQKVSHHGFL